MGLMDFGKLAKLKIKSDSGEIEVMFNPETYSEKFSVVYKERKTANSGVEKIDYIKSIPQDFKLKFIIDATGVTEFSIPGMSFLTKSVYPKVNEFLKLTWYPVNGKPNPLEIKWGEFSFHCWLKDVTIQYQLFNREGLPLRADIDATFIGNSEKNEKNYTKRFQSSLSSMGGTGVSAAGAAGITGSSAAATSTGGAGAGGAGAGSTSGTQNGIVITVS